MELRVTLLRLLEEFEAQINLNFTAVFNGYCSQENEGGGNN